MDLFRPLNDSELQELDDFLCASAVGEEGMNLSQLDGFLTAILIGPHLLTPDQWLPAVWGGEMTFASDEQAERITGLILRHGNDILYCLEDEPDVLEPLLYEEDRDGEAVPILEDWCSGFVRGMAIDEDGWRTLLDTEEGQEMLYAILLFGTEPGWEELDADPDLEDRAAEFADSLPETILKVRDWWLPHRKARSTLRREEPKTGRNDLCPCGSGKKFKKCCGSPERLH